MLTKVGLSLLCLIALIAMSSSGVIANDVQIEFAQKEGILLSKSSVSVVKAEGINEDGGYRITGILNKPHRLPMEGHLHVFALDEKGEITAESKHRIPGLHNAGKGAKKLPFNVLINDLPESTFRILIEHHGPGQKES